MKVSEAVARATSFGIELENQLYQYQHLCTIYVVCTVCRLGLVWTVDNGQWTRQ
jgi:hypothetical protein